MKISEHRERSIKTIYHIALFVILSGMWAGCSSSEEFAGDTAATATEAADTTSSQTPMLQPEIKIREKRKTNAQRFSVQADTVDVQRKKRQGSASSSISVKASAPKKFYTVEVGAFKLKSNVQRHQEELKKRFNLPVRVLYDSTIQLTRVCVGTFSTKTLAADFMGKMRKQFPNDYPDLWVSYWTK